MSDFFIVIGIAILIILGTLLLFAFLGSRIESALLRTGMSSGEASNLATFVAAGGVGIMFLIVGFVWKYFWS